MRPVLIDRLFVIGIAAALTLWCGVLVVLWATGFDPSGAPLAVAAAALMGGTCLALAVPARAAGAIQRLLVLLRLDRSLAMELAMAGSAPAGRQEMKAMIRLLAASAVFAAIVGLVSTAVVFLVSTATGGGAEARFAWGCVAWMGIRLGMQWLAMMPIALGVGVTFLVTVRLRGGSGRDVYATTCREWLMGVSVGLVALGVAWWTAADLLGVALVACVALVGTAAALLQRAKLTVRPRPRAWPVESSGRWADRAGIASSSAVGTAVLLVQMRLLRDFAGVGLGGCLCWAGASIALLAVLLTKADRRSRPPSAAQQVGATLGFLCGVVLQGALGARCVAGGAVAVACGLLAGAAQWPLVALGTMVVSRQRRVFATGGGRAKSYVASVSLGAGVAMAVYAAASAAAAVAPVGIAACLLGMAVAVARGFAAARRRAQRRQWALLGSALIAVTAVAPVLAGAGPWGARAGLWLSSAWAGAERGTHVLLPAGSCGPGRSRAVTDAVAEVFAAHPGRWWVVAGETGRVLDRPLPVTVTAWRSHPDPTALPPSLPTPPGQVAWGSFLYEAARDGRRFDGLLLAPLPADHPEAWRCYVPVVLHRCRRKVHPGGVIALRTQVARGGLDRALSVARAFEEVVGPGWAVVAPCGEGLDMLLVGPAAAPAVAAAVRAVASRPRAGAWAVTLERLCSNGARSGRLGGRGWLRGGADTGELSRRLAELARP